MSSFAFLVILVGLFLVGVPIAFGLGISSIVTMIMAGNIRFSMIGQMMVSGINSFTLLSVPLFLLAGKLMNIGGVTERLFNFCKSLVGFLPGGLGHVNIMASVVFAGMSGTAVSDAGGLGAIEIKAMRDSGYDAEFACAVTAASSTIGPIIPPSLPMVVYGMVGSASVGALFIAGIVPGLLMALAMMAVVAIYAHRKGYPREARPTWRSFLHSLKEGILPLMTPVIIIGGIYSGYFTATEAAVIAVVYAFILSTFVYKEMTWKKLRDVLRESVRDSATIGLILAASTLYGNVLIRAQIPQQLLHVMTSAITSPTVMMLVLNLFLLVVGCFMEPISAITILMPLIKPLITAMGINPVHFGVVMVLNLMVGLLTPPVGMCLFVISRISGLSIARLSKACLPWVIVLMLAVLLLSFCPDIVMFLPRSTGMV